ncbi:hypothetical protein MLD38_030526 [Melastoma candidum]|uniref:Uncharacterized protein n=1 Tax=Melastoma candidum TaxID=119954 RepID=A0ACB9MLW0_9MYRT|nr:hypothetical protein MLD38_030526 [Melastoma candidum]
MVRGRSNLEIILIMAPDLAVVVLITVAQSLSCRGLIRETNVLKIFAVALLCTTHLLACLLGACVVSLPDDSEKPCLHRRIARDALLGAWVAFITAVVALVSALPPYSQFTSCGDGRVIFVGLYSIMHGIFLVQYYVSHTASDEEMVEWMV